ncbi:MAG: hypothetical protein E6H07_00910 [Bacteroidetes bacterium]|nr:MAG: hypothetical protein E6H07_00910 [Bacteroidota bacterium]
MKKMLFLLLANLVLLSTIKAQDEDEDEKKGFKKENLFTGGSISLAFYSNTFLIGGSPVFGYSLTKWLDAGLVINYNYTSYRDVYIFDDRMRQSNWGGGGFVRLYPIKFLFAQAQAEHNWMQLKYIYPNDSSPDEKTKFSGNSFLVGGGYCTGREPKSGQPFYYLSIMFDIGNDINSPYTDAYGRSIPIIRGGLEIPICQGKKRR